MSKQSRRLKKQQKKPIFLYRYLTYMVIAAVIGFFGAYPRTTTSIVITPEKDIVLVAFGDVMFDRGVRPLIEADQAPFAGFFREFNSIVTYPDSVVVNLEGPITHLEKASCQDKAYSFRFDPRTSRMLKEHGITHATLANNHSNDCFAEGLVQTRTYLDKEHISYFGGGSSLAVSYRIDEVGTTTIASVGIDLTIEPIAFDSFLPLVAALNKENDYVVVYLHWGTEYSPDATWSQRTAAYALIDRGADIIIGHHPHVIEPVEVYKGVPIYYSLGNFVFDQRTPETNQGIGVVHYLSQKGIRARIVPYVIKEKIPSLLHVIEAKKFCDTFLGKTIEHDGCEFYAAGNTIGRR